MVQLLAEEMYADAGLEGVRGPSFPRKTNNKSTPGPRPDPDRTGVDVYFPGPHKRLGPGPSNFQRNLKFHLLKPAAPLCSCGAVARLR